MAGSPFYSNVLCWEGSIDPNQIVEDLCCLVEIWFVIHLMWFSWWTLWAVVKHANRVNCLSSFRWENRCLHHIIPTFLPMKSHVSVLVTGDELLQTVTKLSIDLPSIAFSVSGFSISAGGQLNSLWHFTWELSCCILGCVFYFRVALWGRT